MTHILLLFGAAACIAVAVPTSVAAQTGPYDCQNVPLDLVLGKQSMRQAIDALSRQTHCPISTDVDVAGIAGNRVKGRMTPAAAIVMLVKGTGLEGMPINQGLGVGRYVQDAFDQKAKTLAGQVRRAIDAGRISRARGVVLRRQLAAVRTGVRQVAAEQGFVSAAEEATYRRTLTSIARVVGA